MAKILATLAYLYALEVGKAPEEIEVVIVGSTTQRADKIPQDIGTIDWIKRVN